MEEKEREAILKTLLEYNMEGYKIIIDSCFYEADFSNVELAVDDENKLVIIC